MSGSSLARAKDVSGPSGNDTHQKEDDTQQGPLQAFGRIQLISQFGKLSLVIKGKASIQTGEHFVDKSTSVGSVTVGVADNHVRFLFETKHRLAKIIGIRLVFPVLVVVVVHIVVVLGVGIVVSLLAIVLFHFFQIVIGHAREASVARKKRSTLEVGNAGVGTHGLFDFTVRGSVGAVLIVKGLENHILVVFARGAQIEIVSPGKASVPAIGIGVATIGIGVVVSGIVVVNVLVGLLVLVVRVVKLDSYTGTRYDWQ